MGIDLFLYLKFIAPEVMCR